MAGMTMRFGILTEPIRFGVKSWVAVMIGGAEANAFAARVQRLAKNVRCADRRFARRGCVGRTSPAAISHEFPVGKREILASAQFSSATIRRASAVFAPAVNGYTRQQARTPGEREEMEAIKRALMPTSGQINMARDVLWFAAASIGAGLVTALAAAALVVLIA